MPSSKKQIEKIIKYIFGPGTKRKGKIKYAQKFEKRMKIEQKIKSWKQKQKKKNMRMTRKRFQSKRKWKEEKIIKYICINIYICTFNYLFTYTKSQRTVYNNKLFLIKTLPRIYFNFFCFQPTVPYGGKKMASKNVIKSIKKEVK